MTQPIVIDTDPGIDDLLAILFVLSLPDEFDLLALTSIYGNVSTSQATDNAQRILDAAERPDIPVARGADGPLVKRPIEYPAVVHGANGLGEADLAEPSRAPIKTPAALYLYELAKQHPGELVIAAIGPLTNLALAASLYPDFPSLVKQVLIMGGNAFSAGNATAAGEANIVKDPEAADIVFAQDWPIVMAGLDITNTAYLNTQQLKTIGDGPELRHKLLAAATPYYQAFYEAVMPGLDGLRPHDVIPFIWAMRPELFETAELPIAVGLEGLGRGKTWPAIPFQIKPGSPWEGRRPVTILTGGDVDTMAELMTEQLRQ